MVSVPKRLVRNYLEYEMTSVSNDLHSCTPFKIKACLTFVLSLRSLSQEINIKRDDICQIFRAMCIYACECVGCCAGTSVFQYVEVNSLLTSSFCCRPEFHKGFVVWRVEANTTQLLYFCCCSEETECGVRK